MKPVHSPTLVLTFYSFFFCISGTRQKKIIPVLIEECERLDIPHVLRHLTLCDYTRTCLHDWFWEKLYISLKAPLGPTFKNILALRNKVCQAYYWQTVDRIGCQDCNQDLQKKTQSPTDPRQTSATSMTPRYITETATMVPLQTSTTSSTLPYTTELRPTSVDDKILNENLRDNETAETSVSNISTPLSPSSKAYNENSAITNLQLETSRVLNRRDGSRSPQVPSENRAPVPKPFKHSYLPKKRSSSPPEKCDTEPNTKSIHRAEREPTSEECSQSLKTPVEHDESHG